MRLDELPRSDNVEDRRGDGSRPLASDQDRMVDS
jgi:hypothetical protein